MKKIIFLISLLLMFGCDDQKYNEIELIPDYDKTYLSRENVDEGIVAEEIGVDLKNDVENKLNFKKIFNNKGIGPHTFIYDLLINEKGLLDKVRVISGADDLFDRILLELFSKWNYSPGIKKNQKVKSQLRCFFQINFDKEGEYSSNFYFDYDKLRTLGISSENFKKGFYEKVEEMPSIIGGMKAIAENVKYPKDAKESGVQGRVYVKAYIDEEGNVAKSEIIKGIGSGCDYAALEAVNKAKFTPGKKDGKPVKVQVSIPILFKLN